MKEKNGMLCRSDIASFVFKLSLVPYRFLYLPARVKAIRNKQLIKVAFVLSDLGKWKTEPLYRAMLEHPRFEPFILVARYIIFDNSGIKVLTDYLESKHYRYFLLETDHKIADIVKPDIIFYQEPYMVSIDKNKRYRNNLSSLFCYVSYASHTNDAAWFLNYPVLNYCWQVYFENDLTRELASKVMTNKAVNSYVTGLPFYDLFLQTGNTFVDPWKKQLKHKVRIIWAPHHSIKEDDVLDYSTFLKYSNVMLEIAEKYKDSVQMAFKPHPILLTKLYELWGKEETDAYYTRWIIGDNTQLVLGDYVPLFVNSDAMIHDCGSFAVEYHYTRKPVMYLIRDEHHSDGLNAFGKMAFNLHYLGRCEKDIESFINNVIKGEDAMRQAREQFYDNYLLPPSGVSASVNIINAILFK